MNQWIASLQHILDLALGNPGSSLERWVLAVSSFALLWLIFGKAGKMLGAKRTGPFLELAVSVVGILLSMLALAAVKLYLPALGSVQNQVWINIGVPVSVIVVLAAPLTCVIQKTEYITAIVSWVLGVVAAALVILLVSAAFDTFASGSRDAERGKTHKQEVEQVTQ